LLNNFIIAAIPHTEPWGFNTALVMIVSNLAAVAIGRFVRLRQIANTEGSSAAPVGIGGSFNLSELLASFGHILGVGLVLGLTNVGAI
jgi:photosystem I subunit 10